MLHLGPQNFFGFTFDNWGAVPGVTPGTSVVPGASNADGAWTQVATGANMAEDCQWVSIYVLLGNTSAASKMHLLDIGVDNAGGTSYTAVIIGLACGSSPANTIGPRPFSFPFFIKAGSTVAVRVRGNAATAGTVRVAMKFFGRPSNPLMVPIGRFAEAIGHPGAGSSVGVTVTPNNGSYGAWATIGTTTNALWHWEFGYQINNSVYTGATLYAELAYGDATNKHTIQRKMLLLDGAEYLSEVLGMLDPTYCPVPAGSTIYARSYSSAAVVTGHNVIAVGIGG